MWPMQKTYPSPNTQDMVAINMAITNHTLASRPVLVDAFTTAKSKNGRLHFLGLVRMHIL